MDRKLKVVGLGGSLAKHSTSLAALRVALEGADAAGAETELLDVRTLDLPLYSPDAEPPEAARRLAAGAHSADALIWASPLYHGTVSGSFKNALDWLQLLNDRRPTYLTDKVIGLISTASGIYGVQAINTMEFVVRALRGVAVSRVVAVPQAWKAFDETGKPVDAAIDKQLHGLGTEVVRMTQKFESRAKTNIA